ncbi:MAG: elongation factor P maturation arginine rhamnosyltransferase EarP [Rhodoferax sp.]|nr:elongation factor P maturation arginine rhamnosyltransferase EarP [Rhodoferax sp.]
MSGVNTGNLWDIFCRVIDNYGDVGVSWRLAAGLAARGQRVRLWLDDPSALTWMAPHGAPNVEVRHWAEPMRVPELELSDVLIETFGCEISPEFIASRAIDTPARGKKLLWINLEYLTAEGYAERCHGLLSPVMNGPSAGLTKHFFYPGFTPATGGLLREPDLLERQSRFNREVWLRTLGIDFKGERLISLFCYEPSALGTWLDRLAQDPQPSRLLVTPGRSTEALRTCISSKNRLQPGWNKQELLSFSYLPPLTQIDFDHMLWACELNFVRGEDSLVRALWANKPCIWQIYPQHDDAHHAKLAAFLDMMNAPPSMRAVHLEWNGVSRTQADNSENELVHALPRWQRTATHVRDNLLGQVDLVTQLLRLASKNL